MDSNAPNPAAVPNWPPATISASGPRPWPQALIMGMAAAYGLSLVGIVVHDLVYGWMTASTNWIWMTLVPGLAIAWALRSGRPTPVRVAVVGAVWFVTLSIAPVMYLYLWSQGWR
jgi:hypothetical protein